MLLNTSFFSALSSYVSSFCTDKVTCPTFENVPAFCLKFANLSYQNLYCTVLEMELDQALILVLEMPSIPMQRLGMLPPSQYSLETENSKTFTYSIDVACLGYLSTVPKNKPGRNFYKIICGPRRITNV